MNKTRKLTMVAMLCAIAFVVTLFRPPMLPAVPFITYDAKDVVVTIGGFIFGPLSALLISVVVSLVEMLTISTTGYIGFIMNVLATGCFACIATLIYKMKHSLTHAVVGLALGTVFMTIIMILWNYLITPIYMGVPREQVVPLLMSAILPVNLLKGGINMALTLLLYKPIVTALRKANLIPQSEHSEKVKLSGWSIGLGALLLVTCLIVVFIFNMSK